MSPEVPEDQGRETVKPALRDRVLSITNTVRLCLRWASAHRAKAGLIAAASILSLAALIALSVTLCLPGGAVKPATAQGALEALDQGHYEKAARYAKTLRNQQNSSLEALGAAAYVLGSVAAHEAERALNSSTQRYYLLASRYLEEARDFGFPSEREAEGSFQLGYCLYRSGRYAASRAALREALQNDTGRQTEIHRLLANACLKDVNPKLDEALEYNTQVLAGNLSPQGRSDALLQRARILLRNGRINECEQTLNQIPEERRDDADAILVRGQALIEQARRIRASVDEPRKVKPDVRSKLQSAIQTLRLAEQRSTVETPSARRATFLVGVCLAELGQHEEAIAQFFQISRRHPKTPEALAADVEAAQLLGQLGRDNDSVDRYRQVLESVGDSRVFSNPWFTLDELRQKTLAACQRYSENGQFDTALALAGLMHPILPRSRVVELEAEIHRAWGRHLLQATRLAEAEAENQRKAGREQLRRAGASYTALAKLRITTQAYPDDLWAGALSFFEGQNYRAAERTFREYLETETHRRHPQALIYLGQSLLALGRIEEAIQQFEQCIEFHPRDPASFRARLLASAAYREKDEPKKAEALLRENIEGDFLSPASAEWRDSLFALGNLLHCQRRYEEAIHRLDEAVRRYADDHQTTHALYLLGDCYRQTALQKKTELQTEVVPSIRDAGSQKVVQLLDLALKYYVKAREQLDLRQQTQPLSVPEKSTLRNCYFIIGDLEFDLDRHSKAIRSYALATSRYQNEPETLVAYVQMARAYQHLDQVNEARSMVIQAKLALKRIDPAQGFATTTNYSREEWGELLDRMHESMGNTARS